MSGTLVLVSLAVVVLIVMLAMALRESRKKDDS